MWAQVLRHKYGCGNDILPWVCLGSNPSRLWRGIAKRWHHVISGVRWQIGDGERIKFWSDGWISNCDKLYNLAYGPISDSDLNASVSSFVSPSGNVWSSIWKLPVPQRVRSFMWLCAHEKLLTNVERCKRQILDSASCDRCGAMAEDAIHPLRDCGNVKDIWLRLVKPCYWAEFFHEVFSMACWSIWRWRNEQLFQQSDGIPADPIFNILHRVRMASVAYRHILNSGKHPPSCIPFFVKWLPPEMEWVKVNVDGRV
ncbi:ribonuclease H [Senna tora]|uniref:Ribonuclease H n=1 Tax=Senna tora TaxID=362788 RepID=A0A834W946_9FABA|nr:ribonuclease H [Senna tora]